MLGNRTVAMPAVAHCRRPDVLYDDMAIEVELPMVEHHLSQIDHSFSQAAVTTVIAQRVLYTRTYFGKGGTTAAGGCTSTRPCKIMRACVGECSMLTPCLPSADAFTPGVRTIFICIECGLTADLKWSILAHYYRCHGMGASCYSRVNTGVLSSCRDHLPFTPFIRAT